MKKLILAVILAMSLAGSASAGTNYVWAQGSSSTPYCQLVSLTHLGATITLTSDVCEVLVYGSLDTSGTALIHASFVSMADAAADGAMETGQVISGVGVATTAKYGDPIFLPGLRLKSAMTLYLWTPVGAYTAVHVIYRKRISS